MKLYTDQDAINSCSGKYLLLDNDFLGELYNDEEILTEFLNKFRESYLILDPLTKFEFLRDLYTPQIRKIKELFVSKLIFLPLPNRQEIFIKQQENAMELSRIYSHKGYTKTKISLVDLFLGGRAMFNATSVMVVTGNKKDFPNNVFDVVDVVNIEQNDGSMKPYTLVIFNYDKYDRCKSELKKIEEKFEKEKRNIEEKAPF